MPSARRRGKTRHMIDLLRFVSGLAADLVRRHGELVAENVLLRQQLIVAHRKTRAASGGRLAWREATLLVQPATILRWHRAGFRAFWRRRSRRSGRPPASRAALIREMAARNPRWGAERIRGELLSSATLDVGAPTRIRVAERPATAARTRPDGPRLRLSETGVMSGQAGDRRRIELLQALLAAKTPLDPLASGLACVAWDSPPLVVLQRQHVISVPERYLAGEPAADGARDVVPVANRGKLPPPSQPLLRHQRKLGHEGLGAAC